ncbi:MAG TPA: hypothetical protein VFQ35_03305, partial [Polyangiaceae bacterium]|nr:hypothetical protein [Polyangiaceae bacterium]
TGRKLELVERAAIRGALAPRALVASTRKLYIADQVTNALITVDKGELSEQHQSPTCRRPSSLALAGAQLVVNCLFEHAISVRSLDALGLPGRESARIENAGPFWAIAALEADGASWIAASGVEDRALERFDGAFGYVDSFASLFRVSGSRWERVWSANVSELSVLVPKALLLERTSPSHFAITVSSTGTDRLLRFDVDAHARTSSFESAPFAPGVTDLLRVHERLYAASTLLDAWIAAASEPSGEPSLKQIASAPVAVNVDRRLGEALAFTSLIAPHATSAGQNSRFTCETCHFEGGVDARVHHTGRGNVHVVTRPLFGLLRNAPHFSRALDPDLTSVSHNEFRVAGLGNPDDPWFTLRTNEFPWLAALGVRTDVGPEALRRALLEFLAGYEFPKNPRTRGRHRFSPDQARGAELFRDHCETCHAARLASDDSATHVGFEGWEPSLFELDGPLVWARGDYERTGVLPYVNEKGTRVPSLRRVADKFPYFTNGSARSLEAVVARSARVGGYFSHAAPDAEFEGDDARALVAFLELL